MTKIDIKKDAVELLLPELKEYFFSTLGHKYLTAVQQCALHYFLANYDCVVQAPTGSGKTLAYILPTLQLVQQKRTKFNELNKCEIYALIVNPSRELVVQIYTLIKSICDTLNIKVLRLVGGVKIQPEKFFKGQCIMLATPGSLEHWAEKLPAMKNFLKPLLVLVLDEADRYSHAEFKKSMTSFMALLPKQRRTSLFSATQAKYVEEFLKFGLRNSIRLSVTSDKSTTVSENLDGDSVETKSETSKVPANKAKNANNVDKSSDKSTKTDSIMPAELVNYYTLVDADKKFLALVNLLNSISNAKVLIFLCSGACVEYFEQILLKYPMIRDVFALHGKLDKKKRVKTLEKFRKSSKGILLSTDLMARGLDLVDIDWVFQYDIPKYSSMFIHRSGRTARIGHAGNSLIFLTNEEAAYIDYIQNHENIHLREYKLDGLTVESAQKLRAKVQDLAVSDRAILEAGTRAFVSFVQAYCKHDCNVVCRLDDLDLAGIAHSFALLRMPQMPELRKSIAKIRENFEPRTDVVTSQVAFKNAKAEARRQERIREKQQNAASGGNSQKIDNNKRKIFHDDDEDNTFKNNNGNVNGKSEEKKRPKRKKLNEWDDLKQSASLLKKLKRGKLTKTQVDEML